MLLDYGKTMQNIQALPAAPLFFVNSHKSNFKGLGKRKSSLSAKVLKYQTRKFLGFNFIKNDKYGGWHFREAGEGQAMLLYPIL